MDNHNVTPLQKLGNGVSKCARKLYTKAKAMCFTTNNRSIHRKREAYTSSTMCAGAHCFKIHLQLILCSMHMGGQLNKMHSLSCQQPLQMKLNYPHQRSRSCSCESDQPCKIMHTVFCACQGDIPRLQQFN